MGTTLRAWLKTGTYAAMHLLVAMAVAFAISGSWRVAFGIGIVEPAVQTLFYTLHERIGGHLNRRRAPARSAAPAKSAPRGSRPAILRRPCPACP
jgi:uncharacterized membrane protein